MEDLYDELDWIILDADPRRAGPEEAERAREQLVGRLHTERYLALLDRLVTATRAPKLGDASALATGEALTDLLDSVVSRFRRGVDRLSPDAPPQVWEDAWRSIGQLQWVADVSTHVMPAETERIQHRLDKSRQLLNQIHEHHAAGDRAVDEVIVLPALEAFEAGRAYERDLEETRRLKEEFLALWTKTKRKLDA